MQDAVRSCRNREYVDKKHQFAVDVLRLARSEMREMQTGKLLLSRSRSPSEILLFIGQASAHEFTLRMRRSIQLHDHRRKWNGAEAENVRYHRQVRLYVLSLAANLLTFFFSYYNMKNLQEALHWITILNPGMQKLLTWSRFLCTFLWTNGHDNWIKITFQV